ncbi:MAG: isocitrate/isopropylmalate family dehydrogenase [Phycisphaerales bacterium]|jgi:isocitrate dehydrogenase|nr:isocitrate/isopropylmalate family dehydrogenase [Phycisphaerales bacterium]
MSKLRIALAPGDGIGPEITEAVLTILKPAGVLDLIEFVPVEMGERFFATDSRGLTDTAVAAIEETGLLLKGPMGTPIGGGGKSINVTLRKMYNAYANVRHFQSLPGVETVYSKAKIPVDFYVIRENIEDTYGGIEHRLTNDVVECKRLISAPGSDQVHRAAFELARRLNITKVHCGHKANIMKMSDGLFLDRFRKLGQDYPSIETADVIIDALCMNLVLKPQQYRMIVLPNLQGDIVSDLAAGLVGGLGFAPSANIGNHVSIFEAVHGTAPDIAGKGIANPTSLLLSTLMMLRHVGLMRHAAIIENALLATLESGVHTGDFGTPGTPSVGTHAYAEAIAKHIGKKPSSREPLAETGGDAVCFERPPRPRHNTLIRTYETLRSVFVGADVYLDTVLGPQEIAEKLQAICAPTPFKLVMMSNRGTQVWPSGSVYTEIVDYYRARFLLRDMGNAPSLGQGPIIALLDRIAEKFEITDFQPIKHYDGKPGYSLAQGQ